MIARLRPILFGSPARSYVTGYAVGFLSATVLFVILMLVNGR